jgi:hypothetical protein
MSLDALAAPELARTSPLCVASREVLADATSTPPDDLALASAVPEVIDTLPPTPPSLNASPAATWMLPLAPPSPLAPAVTITAPARELLLLVMIWTAPDCWLR